MTRTARRTEEIAQGLHDAVERKSSRSLQRWARRLSRRAKAAETWDQIAVRRGEIRPLDLYERRAGRMLLRAQLSELRGRLGDGWDADRVTSLLDSYVTSVEIPPGRVAFRR